MTSPFDSARSDIGSDAFTPDSSSDASDADLLPFDAEALFARHTGSVTIAQASVDVAGMTFAYTLHGASFFNANADAGSVCDHRVEGPCLIWNCSFAPGALAAPDASTGTPSPSAGIITISGGTMPPITLTPDALGHYAGATDMFARWHDGDRISVMAAGGEVPAFAADLVFPPQVTIDQPAPLFAVVPINRATGLDVRWTGTGPRQMQVTVAETVTHADNSTTSHDVLCWYPISDLSATVPPSAFRDFEPSMDAGTNNVAITISPMAIESLTAGDYQVFLTATPGAFIGTGFVQ